MPSQTRFTSQVRGWPVAAALGLIVGTLVGLGALGAFSHALWPALAGVSLGLASAFAAPARPVRVALCGGGVAVVAATAMVVAVQVQRGVWPIVDEGTIAQYGTTAQAVLRTAAIWGASLGVPCLVAAALVAAVRHRGVRCGTFCRR